MSDQISLSLADPGKSHPMQKLGSTLVALALLAALVAVSGLAVQAPSLFFWLIIGLTTAGGILYSIPYFKAAPASQNNGIMHSAATNRGAIAWGLAIFITGFYIILYWFPYLLEGLIRTMDPLSFLLRGKEANHWFMYGMFYTVAVLIMGIRFIGKYRHNRYQVIRTISVMFFQLGFAFLIPAFLEKLNQPEFYFS